MPTFEVEFETLVPYRHKIKLTHENETFLRGQLAEWFRYGRSENGEMQLILDSPETTSEGEQQHQYNILRITQIPTKWRVRGVACITTTLEFEKVEADTAEQACDEVMEAWRGHEAAGVDSDDVMVQLQDNVKYADFQREDLEDLRAEEMEA